MYNYFDIECLTHSQIAGTWTIGLHIEVANIVADLKVVDFITGDM